MVQLYMLSTVKSYSCSLYVTSVRVVLHFTDQPQAIATLITCVYIIVAEFGAPALYNYWAVLSLDIFLVIFWLISFGLLASEVAYLSSYLGYYGATVGDGIFVAILAAASGIGGLEL